VPTDDKSVEEIVATRLLRVSAAVHGIVTGLIVGLGIFVATNWLVLKGGRVVGPHLLLLRQFFIGYRVTFVGSLIGFAYGFVLGFAVGYAVAWLYNRLLVWRGVRGSVSAGSLPGRGGRAGR
jgi:hypothetical protein